MYCCLYKVAQGATILQCNELFAVGKSTIGLVIREVVAAINRVYTHVIHWPRGHEMREVMLEFKKWCGIPFVHSAIDCTHIGIQNLLSIRKTIIISKKVRIQLEPKQLWIARSSLQASLLGYEVR